VTADASLGIPGAARLPARGYGAFVDSDRYSRTAVTPAAGAGGAASLTAQFQAVGAGRLWLVERIVVSCTSAAPTSCALYQDQADALHLLEGTSAGNFDVSDERSPLVIDSLSLLLVVWSPVTGTIPAGAVGTCRVQVRELQRVSGVS